MKITYSWLKEYVDVEISAKDLAQRLTMSGLEVTSLERQAGDWLFDIEVTSNRPDCLSIVGIAREVAAITKSKIKNQKSKFHIKIQGPKAKCQKPISVVIQDKKDCLMYVAKVIKGVKVGPSPRWLKKRLESLGLRSVNNVVDITNFVLLELGQPLHAFDYDRLGSTRIIIRRAKDNEDILTIDGRKRRLCSEMLVVATDRRPVAIAGVIGDKTTEVAEGTRNILLESAFFSSAVVRRTSRLLGLTTESSYRFERGLDPQGVLSASDRAGYLISQICGGRLSSNLLVKTKGLKLNPKQILLDLQKANDLLGTPISKGTAKRLLNSLGLETTEIGSSGSAKLRVKIPTFRADIGRPVDLIEEIARLWGYDRIPKNLPAVRPQPVESQRFEKSIKGLLVGQGFSEIITYSLISRDLLEASRINYNDDKLIYIENPVSRQYEVMRPHLLPGLLQVVAHNLNKQVSGLKLFELDKIYLAPRQENFWLSLGITGELDYDWSGPAKEASFHHLKGIFEMLFERLGLGSVEFSNSSFPYFLPGRQAVVKAGGLKLGQLGEVSSEVLSNFDIEKRVFAAQIDLDLLKRLARLDRKFVPLAKFPASFRDISLIVRSQIPSGSVVATIKKAGGDLLSEVELFDVYTGKQVPQGYKSLAYSLGFSARDHTLTYEEVDGAYRKICQAISEELGAKIRQ
jgi:phenylalanyl-tRNA synthetase beta chain